MFLKSRVMSLNVEDAMKKCFILLLWAIGLLVIIGSSRADVIYVQVDEKGTVCFTDNPVSPRARVHQESWQESTSSVMKNLTLGNRPGPKETGRPASAPSSVAPQPEKAELKEDTAGIIKHLTYGNRRFPRDQLLLFYKSISQVERLQEEQERRRRSQVEASQPSTSSRSTGSRRRGNP
jgi:hypothetical protein